MLGIPNPIGFVPLADALSREWPMLRNFYALSRFSTASPVVNPAATRALITGFSPRAREQAAHRRAAADGYLLRADVERCSASVDHAALARVQAALPQGLNAPSERSFADLVSNLQRGVARGLPVGPDSSLALLEMLLTAVDLQLEAEALDLHGLRRCDNYEFECRSEPAAMAVHGALEASLREYGLRLHPGKPSVHERRAMATPDWVGRLDALPLRAEHLELDAETFAENVSALVAANPGEPVADRALGRTRTVGSDARSLPPLRAVRMRIATAAPAVLRFALLLLRDERERGVPMDVAWLERELQAIIVRHAPLGHASEMAWALWASLAFGVRLDTKCAAAVSRMDDDVVALLALEAQSRGRFRQRLDTSAWTALLDEQALSGEHWLLACEAAAHGWLRDAPGVRAVEQDRSFGPLMRAGVRIFEASPLAATA